jgi:hypothetical protein
MTDQPSRSAPLVTILIVMAGFALFLLVAVLVYVPHRAGPFTGDGIRTAEQRKANLVELRKKENDANSYGWVDPKAGIVRLPRDVAMELTVQKYAAKR